MSSRGYSVDLAALSGYQAHSRGLAQDVRAVATGHLGAHRAIPASLLGDLGEETGLHAALARRIGELHGAVHALSESVGSLGEHVAAARADYEIDERRAADSFRRLQG